MQVHHISVEGCPKSGIIPYMKRISLRKLFISVVVTMVVVFTFFGSEAIPQYRTTKLQKTDVQKEVEFTTNWYPVGYATVSLGNSLDVRKVYVKENQKVSKGDVLAKLNDETEYNQYKTAQASYNSAIKAKWNAQKVPGTPQSTIDSLQGQINVAYYQVKNAEVAMSKKLVKSPITGKVISITFADYSNSSSTLSTGLLASGGSSAVSGNYMVIADTTNAVLRVEVSDKDLAKLELGMAVMFENRVTEEVLNGKVTSINKAPLSATAEDPTYAIMVTLDKYPTLPYGTKLDGAVITALKQGTLAVQYDAITLDSATSGTVLVLRDGKVETVNVKVGTIGDDAIEITEGLTEADEVVVDKLADKKVIAFRPWIKKLFGINK